MIKRLILSNLVLVETCEIHFGPHFNAITGETGAGKTALLEAIHLSLGGRADSSLIRKGEERAFVEIAFDIEEPARLKELLEPAGIDFDPSEYLIIRRELVREGKNRAFINCHMVPLPLLQSIGSALIDLISQHSHEALRTSDAQRALLDRYGSLDPLLLAFQEAYREEKRLSKTLEELKTLGATREREEETFRFQLGEIETVGLKKGEEEALFEQYQRLSHSQEISAKVHTLTEGLSTLTPTLARLYKTCDSLAPFDKTLEEPTLHLHEALIHLQESSRSLASYADRLESDPSTLAIQEARLSTISRLKRKYGNTWEEVETYAERLRSDLLKLETLVETTEQTEEKLSKARALTDEASRKLTAAREGAAARFQKVLTAQIRELNMQSAELTITLKPTTRHSFGDDTIDFYLMANRGEHPALVKDHASGGELSRLLFAIKIALAEKNDTPTLLFDEIDANVGGKTATLIGEKLQVLGTYRQVICITHFPQVASKAETHFAVQKVEREGRTLTEIQALTEIERQGELLRMLGGDPQANKLKF
ncbi:MAG: DNA repair protein RecN [Verrucomicrobia bacterium]|nr:DNA repair protein RecN [Verrucomicrobiota bacterium]